MARNEPTPENRYARQVQDRITLSVGFLTLFFLGYLLAPPVTYRILIRTKLIYRPYVQETFFFIFKPAYRIMRKDRNIRFLWECEERIMAEWEMMELNR